MYIHIHKFVYDIQLPCGPTLPPCLGLEGRPARSTTTRQINWHINQNMCKNCTKKSNKLITLYQKSIKIGPKGLLGGIQMGPKGSLGGIWGPSWLQEAPRSPKSPKRLPQGTASPLLWASFWGGLGTKIEQNPSKNQSKIWSIFWLILEWLLDRFWDKFWKVLGVKLGAMLTKKLII